MDAVLMFDVLMYLNVFYYPIFALSHPLMQFAKFISPNYDTPDLIVVDATVVTTLILSDLIKIIVFRRMREERRVVAVLVAVLLTVVSISCVLYILIQQEQVLRMEYIICSISFVLFVNELAFGTLQFFPCCQKPQYK